MKVVVEREFAGRKISLTTGEMAKQAAGAVLVQYGDTVVFVAAQNGPSRPGTDFFPLTCDYRERSAADTLDLQGVGPGRDVSIDRVREIAR